MKRIINIGKTSKGVVIPKSWLLSLHKEYGKIDFVSMEVNEIITIKPFTMEAHENQAKEKINSLR